MWVGWCRDHTKQQGSAKLVTFPGSNLAHLCGHDHRNAFLHPPRSSQLRGGELKEHGHEEREEALLRRLLDIERHEDQMMAAMVQLGSSSERLNKRLAGLTWVMLLLTWITFIVAIPNTLATIFGIPKVSEVLGLEVMVLVLTLATVAGLVVVLLPYSKFSISSLEKRSARHVEE